MASLYNTILHTVFTVAVVAFILETMPAMSLEGAVSLETGDLVFVNPPPTRTPFGSAILKTGEATIGWMIRNGYEVNTNETAIHVAIAKRGENADSLSFVQAVPGEGVVITPAAEFFDENQGATLYAAKVVGAHIMTRVAAVREAESQVGKPYANDFAPVSPAESSPSQGFYCSSLVDWSYARAYHSARLDAFIDKRFTLLFVPIEYWKQYYRSIGMPLPVNVSGTNPTLLLHSPRVSFRRFHVEAKSKL